MAEAVQEGQILVDAPGADGVAAQGSAEAGLGQEPGRRRRKERKSQLLMNSPVQLSQPLRSCFVSSGSPQIAMLSLPPPATLVPAGPLRSRLYSAEGTARCSRCILHRIRILPLAFNPLVLIHGLPPGVQVSDCESEGGESGAAPEDHRDLNRGVRR